jgi:hypothetical protein
MCDIHMVHTYVSLYDTVYTTLYANMGFSDSKLLCMWIMFSFFYDLCVYIMYAVELSSNGDHHVLFPCLL